MTSTEALRVIDPWVNVRLRGLAWQMQAGEAYFKRSADDLRSRSPEEIIGLMDPLGVEKAIIGVNAEAPEQEILKFVERYPDRFAFGVHVDPRRGLKAVRAVEGLVKNQPVVAVRLLPCVINVAPSDRIYYPLYAKCVELGLPVAVTTGIPGPQLPGKCQDPMHLEDVCLFFPELTVVMANGADPWWSVAIRLMLKFPNLYLMTSSVAPKYLPEELVHYMNTRGQEKILYATDFPFLEMSRCVAEARALDLREGALDKYLHANASRVFFRLRDAAGA